LTLGQLEEANYENNKSQPHETLPPRAEEANEGRIIGVPAAAVKVGEKGIWSFTRLRVLAIQRFR